MKIITKIGVGIIIAGAVLTAAGGTICAVSPNNLSETYFGKPVSYENTVNGDVTELELNVSFADIKIISGTEFKLVAEDVPEKLMLEVSESDGKVKIENKEDLSSFKNKNIHFGSISDGNVGEYTLYVPSDNLKTVNIEAAFSEMTLSSVRCAKLDIECSFGEYNLNNSEAENFSIASSFGDTSLDKVNCGKADITNSFGSFKADSFKITQSGEIENSFGDFKAKLSGDNYDFSAFNSMGSLNTFVCPDEEVKINITSSFGDTTFTN